MESKTCKKCGNIMVVKSGKFGKFWACTGYPTCKTTEKYIFTAPEVVKVESKKFNPTAKQVEIFNAMKADKNLIVSARPGSGKTATITAGLEYIASSESVLLVAFNKSIATELQNRISRDNTTASTLHASGFKICKSIYGSKVKVNADKYNDIIMTCGLIPEDSRKGMINPIKKILSLLNANLLDVSIDNIKSLNERYNFETEINAALVEILNYVKTTGIAQANNQIDFDDMINLPLLHKFNHIAEVVICDESQDLSPANLELIARLGRRFIFVGDMNQSIYAFRGADSESMQNIKTRFSCVELPLDETFRIPKNIVKELNARFPEITLYSHKDGGKIEYIKESALVEKTLEYKKVNVLCRNNAPLIKPVFEIIRSGRRAVIRGKDMSESLINLIMRVNHNNIPDMIAGLESYYNGLCKKFENAKNKSFLDVIDDSIKTISAICESDKVNSVNDLIGVIQSLFSDSDSEYDYIFSTIHKSKGTESEVVILYQPELIGSKAKTEGDKIQEENLLWVGMTRSLDTLIITSKE